MILVGLLVFLVFAGLLLWIVPMQPEIKSLAVKIVIVIAVLLLLLFFLQLAARFGGFDLGRFR